MIKCIVIKTLFCVIYYQNISAIRFSFLGVLAQFNHSPHHQHETPYKDSIYNRLREAYIGTYIKIYYIHFTLFMLVLGVNHYCN